MKVISDEKRIYLSCKSLLTKQEIERLLLFYCFVFPTFDNILLAMCPTKNNVIFELAHSVKVISDEKRIYLSCKSLLTKQEIERLLLFYCFVFPTFDNILLAICPTKNRFSTIRGISMFKKAIFSLKVGMIICKTRTGAQMFR